MTSSRRVLPGDPFAAAVERLRAESDAQRSEIEALREENRVLRARLQPREGAKKGGRPPMLPADLGEQLDALIARGFSVRRARSVLRNKYQVTSQGMGQALKRQSWGAKTETKSVPFTTAQPATETRPVSFEGSARD